MERGFNAVAAEMTLQIFLKQRKKLSETITQVVFETANKSRLDDV